MIKNNNAFKYLTIPSSQEILSPSLQKKKNSIYHLKITEKSQTSFAFMWSPTKTSQLEFLGCQNNFLKEKTSPLLKNKQGKKPNTCIDSLLPFASY